MQENLLGQGVELMLFGMATVVTFLTLLVLATSEFRAERDRSSARRALKLSGE